jgi:hypothetical protein
MDQSHVDALRQIQSMLDELIVSEAAEADQGKEPLPEELGELPPEEGEAEEVPPPGQEQIVEKLGSFTKDLPRGGNFVAQTRGPSRPTPKGLPPRRK